MKKVYPISVFICLALCMSLVITSTTICAQERFPLGRGNFALKLGYIDFTSDFTSSRTDRYDSDGFYIGIEGYGKISPRLYLGG